MKRPEIISALGQAPWPCAAEPRNPALNAPAPKPALWPCAAQIAGSEA